MRPDSETESVFQVNPYSDPVIVRVEGRANFQNSGCLRDFAAEMLRQGKPRFVLDLAGCTSMDSTFLGVLAGLAIELRQRRPAGSVVLARVGARNLELIRNLGLHRLLSVEGGEVAAMAAAGGGRDLECGPRSELESARLVLEAHENLVAVDEGNRAKFQDVLTFMKQRVDQG
jgi:anti-anti-sigma factor